MKTDTTPTTAELVAQQIIDYMGEYLEGNPLLVQENAVRHAIEQSKLFDKLQAAQEMANALRKQNSEVRLMAASHGKLLAVMETDNALKAWREAGGQ